MARPVALPLVAFLVASALASPLLAEMQDLTHLDPDVLRLTVFSTAIGAGVVWLLWRRGLPFPPVNSSVIDKTLLFAVAACLIGVGIAFGLAEVEGAPWRPPKPGSLGAPVALVMIVQLLGAAAEEVGWRGVVQPLLETRLAPLQAALITGVLFGLGHFYLAFAIAPASFALFVVSAIAISMILAVATFGRTLGARIVIATFLHYLLNMATLSLFSDGDGSVLYFADLAAAFGVCGAIAWVPLIRHRGMVTT
jgi:membrane protease YdiL (CAAX protease family)